MNIQKIESYPYELKFKFPFKNAKRAYKYRHGFIIKIFAENSLVGLGEVAPLEEFHAESLQECSYGLEAINQAIKNLKTITKEELLQIFKLHSEDIPSLLFGLETALFDIASQQLQLPTYKYLNKNSIETINLNGLDGIHDKEDGFNIIKVKLGYRNIYDDIEKMQELTNYYGEKVKFRIDVNESLDLVKAIRFCKSMEKFNIDYIEQPLSKNELEDLAELRMHTKIKIAVDESLRNIQSANDIIKKQAADIFIIKPMVIGSYLEINQIINIAKKNDIECVITNMLDSGVNRMACMHIALSNNINRECGISGDNLFESEMYQTPEIINGQINFSNTIYGLGIKTND